MGLPENVHLHTNPGKVMIADEDGVSVFLLPAPLRYMASTEDLTTYMDAEPTPEGAIRIGMAHGSIQGFGSEAGPRTTFRSIEPDRRVSPTSLSVIGIVRFKSTNGLGTRAHRSPTNSGCRLILLGLYGSAGIAPPSAGNWRQRRAAERIGATDQQGQARDRPQNLQGDSI
jgi:hypothetical protein